MLRFTLTLVLLAPMVVISASLPPNWQLVGEAELKFFWFPVYDARLYSPEGDDPGIEGPLILSLQYHRPISRDKLLSETRRQLQNQKHELEAIDQWLEQLADIWPSVEADDQLAFHINESGSGAFFYNGQWIGSIHEPDFSQAFAGIWLSSDSPYPAKARQLRGDPANAISE